MKEQWSEGPWTVGYTYPDGETTITVFNADGDEICNLGNTLLNEESHANIMAAAHDMYEALSELLKDYVELGESGDCGLWDVDKTPFVIKARAALKKARGES